MDHVRLMLDTLGGCNQRVLIEWNSFQPPYDTQHGWPMRLPDVDWNQTDWLVLIFQDFVTMRDGHCLELERVEHQYQDRCSQVIVLHWPHDLGRYHATRCHLVEFNIHEYNILKNLCQDQAWCEQMCHTQHRTGWQCLNGSARPHRRLVAKYLAQNWSGGTLSFHDWMPLADWPYHTIKGTSNELNWLRLLPVYQRHQFNIVTETQYYQVPGIVTEKTVFAMLAGQIPVVIGYQGIVKDCESMGFDMFTDIVDTSYDSLPDHERWKAALDLNHDVVMRYKASRAVQQRLQEQARWLLETWPDQHARQAMDRLRAVIKG